MQQAGYVPFLCPSLVSYKPRIQRRPRRRVFIRKKRKKKDITFSLQFGHLPLVVFYTYKIKFLV